MAVKPPEPSHRPIRAGPSRAAVDGLTARREALDERLSRLTLDERLWPTIARPRAAQVTHNTVERELLLDRLDCADLKRLRELWEKAMRSSVSSPVWPL